LSILADSRLKEVIMRNHRNGMPWRIAMAFVVGTASLALTTAAQADNRAAQKLGQIGVINQSLQPKQPKSSPGYSNGQANSANAANAANTANTPTPVTGGPHVLPGTGGTPPSR
jgi:hypothetical protein